MDVALAAFNNAGIEMIRKGRSKCIELSVAVWGSEVDVDHSGHE